MLKTSRVMALLTLLFATSSPIAAETPQQRGRVIADGLCSRCHAIGLAGDSPSPAAPQFRTLDSRTDLSKLARRIREGLLTGHEGMPVFRFDGDDADAMVAYIRSVQDP